MYDELIDILYTDDEITIREYSLSKIVIYYTYDDYKNFKIEHIAKAMTTEMAQFLAPMFKQIIKRTIEFAQANGYRKGEQVGKLELRNKIKDLLGITE